MLFSAAQRLPRSALLLVVLFGCILSLYTLYRLDLHAGYSLPLSKPPVTIPNQNQSLLEAQRSLWQPFYQQLLQHRPHCDPVPHSEIGDLGIGYDASNHGHQRPDRLSLSSEQISELRSTHGRFVEHLKTEGYSLPVVPNTRGIVTTAGGKYLPVALVSIRMLRSTGSQLPVEVFLASQDEWDPEICDSIFPSLNARCLVLEDIFNPLKRKSNLGIDKYQYKVMSIVFSSFEEVLFLDSDCFPVSDPTIYFETEPFLSTGMIRWPDFWFPTESPRFFEIAGISEPAPWENSATESGELFYSKKKHTNSLLLSIYYNFYGPEFYYPLQSQGAPGEGDKETFLWSAVVFNETFYSVRKPVKALGYRTTAGEWRGSAMAQFDPAEDSKSHDASPGTNAEIRPLFVHANFPKLDPSSIFQDVSFGATGPTKDADGKLRRIWFDDEQKAIDFFGFDLERRMWEVLRDLACEFEGKISAWEGKSAVCEQATTYWNTVFGKESEQHG
jgi:alpha 1,2-mannosyltransferase